jgi:putative transferase (TIGR04331 family)
MKLITTGGVPIPDSEPVVFLGPWCETQEKASAGSWQFDGYAKPDKRADLEQQSREISESIFPDLASALNELHGRDIPNEFWSRTIKLWLEIFTDVVYQRWDCITEAISTASFTSAAQVATRRSQLTPKTRLEIQRLINSHEWNHLIFGEILDFLQFPREEPGVGEFVSHPNHLKSKHFNPKRGLIKRLASWLNNALARRAKYMIIQTYLPRKVEIRLAIRLRTLPFKWEDVALDDVEVDNELRGRVQIKTSESRDAEQFIRKIISRHIPMLYIEHFQKVSESFTKKTLPSHPTTIFTSNLHMASEQFLMWMSHKALGGTRLVIGQHGGVHGMSKFDSQEFRHEMQIANSYLSWGWTSSTKSSVVPSLALINANNGDRRNAPSSLRSTLLFVVDSTYRYPSPNRGINGPLVQYLNNCFAVTEQLSPVVRDNTCVRLYHEHEYFDNNQKPFWNSRFPILNVSTGHTPMKQHREQARIVLCTSIGTTYIETIHRNIPTVIFLDPAISPLKAEHAQIFESMKHSGVLHFSAESAAAHINSVWDKVDEWWQSEPVRDSITQFSNLFNRTVNDPISFLQSVISGNLNQEESR